MFDCITPTLFQQAIPCEAAPKILELVDLSELVIAPNKCEFWRQVETQLVPGKALPIEFPDLESLLKYRTALGNLQCSTHRSFPLKNKLCTKRKGLYLFVWLDGARHE